MAEPQIYRSQATISPDTGGRPISTRARSDPFVAEARSRGLVAGQVADFGQKLYAHELKIQRDSEQAAATSAYKSKLSELVYELSPNDNPIEAEKLYNRRAKEELAKLERTGAIKFSDGIVRRRFLSSAAADRATALAKVKANARERQASTFIARTATIADEAIRNYRTATPSEKLQIEDTLFGPDSLYRKMEQNGFITAEQRQKFEKTNREDIALGEVQGDLLAASRASNGDRAEQLYEDLNDPNKYPYLAADDRDKYLKQASDLSTRLDAKFVRDDAAKQRDANATLKRNQKKTQKDLIRRIYKYRQDPSNNDPVTMDEVLDAELSAAGYDKVVAALDKIEDPITVDTNQRLEHYKEIRAAATQAELDEIEQNIWDLVGTKYDLDTALALERRIDARKKRTPEYRQIKGYESVLERLTEAEGILDQIMPGASARGAAVMEQFHADVDAGVDVQEAFLSAIEAFRGKITLRSIPRPRVGPQDKSIDKWTLEDVAIAEEELKTYSGNTRVMAGEYWRIVLLKRYLEAQKATNDDVLNNPHINMPRKFLIGGEQSNSNASTSSSDDAERKKNKR